MVSQSFGFARQVTRLGIVAGAVVTLSLGYGTVAAVASPGSSGSSQSDSSSASQATPAASSHESQGTAGTSGTVPEAQPLSTADMNSGGANGQCGSSSGSDGIYCSTRPQGASQNGNGGGQATGEPCMGCVGKADNKNPPGQETSSPQSTFPNNGYECDNNNGIGKGNPAHTGCSGSTETTTCPSGQSMNSAGSCESPSASSAPSCPAGQTMTTAGACRPNVSADTGSNPDTTVGAHTTVGANTTTSASTGSSTGGATVVLGQQLTRPQAAPAAPVTAAPRSAAVLGTRQVRTASLPTHVAALPFTGSNVDAMARLGLLCVIAGAPLLLAGRRRRPQ